MPSVAPDEAMVDKPPEKHLSDALKEMFANLDIKEVTPEVIISQFSKSGGIDRLRIAIERKMKGFLDSHQHYTVKASQEYLNRAVSKEDDVLQPHKLMQQTQDVVLSTVKDRIGKDIDSVTEQGKADWFLECIRNEILNATKKGEKTAKVEEEPLPTKTSVAGAKAILNNLSRTAVRPRQVDHEHDSARQALNKEQHANGHVEDATNGMLSHDEKQSASKGDDVRTETAEEKQKKENTIEVPHAESGRNEAKVAPKSPSHNAKKESVRKASHPSPEHTPPATGSGIASKQSSPKTEQNEKDKRHQATKEDKDYSALADKMLFGGNSDEEMSEEDTPKDIGMSVSMKKAEVQSKLTESSDLEATKKPAARDERRQDSPGDSISHPSRPETTKDTSGTTAPKSSDPSKADDGAATNEGSTSRTREGSKVETGGRSDGRDLRRTADDTLKPKWESPGDGKPRKDDVQPKMKIIRAKTGAEDYNSDVKMTGGKIQEQTQVGLDVKQQDNNTKGNKNEKKSAKKNTSSESPPENKEMSKTGKKNKDKGRTSSVDNGSDVAGAETVGKVKKSSESSDASQHQPADPIQVAATSGRRSSRRISLRTPTMAEVIDPDSIEAVVDMSDSQAPVLTKKGRGRKPGPKKITEAGITEPRTARKKGKKEVIKDRDDNSAKKRKRKHQGEDVAPRVLQSAEHPDPAVENWPRGYGVTRSCVPEDYGEQQKVLHALEMLLAKDCAEPFAEPVDTKVKGLEMYTKVIKNPMDLGEICERLRNSSSGCGYYENAKEVLEDIDLIWWNCKKYNGQFDPIVVACEESQQELSFLLEQHGIQVDKGPQKRRRVSRGRLAAEPSPEEDPKLGDNDGRLVGKSVMIFTELKKRKKEWFKVDVKSYDKRTKTYTLLWAETGKTTKKATFGTDKVFPVYRLL